MAKDFNINVVYEGKSKILQCPPNEFLNVVTKSYGKTDSEFDIFVIENGSRRKISPFELTDLMKVEIVPRMASKNMNNQRNLCSYFDAASSKEESFVEKIMTKLKNNSSLNGLERKYLMDMLESSASVHHPAKRKRDDGNMNGHVRCETKNKKLQAQPSSQFSKESFTQTDVAFSLPDQVIAEQDQEVTQDLMKSTFDDRRNFILIKTPLVVSIRHKYPLLFSVNEIKKELDRIFYSDKCRVFMDNIDMYSGIILDSCDTTNDLYKRTVMNMEKCHTVEQKKYARAVGSILVLPSMVNEDLGFLNTVENFGKSDIYPYIDASVHSLKEFFFDNLLFKIIAEGQLLCEASNFKESILCLMAAFYVFNMDYTQGCENTLTIFEKLYLDANETIVENIHTEQLIKLFKLKANAK